MSEKRYIDMNEEFVNESQTEVISMKETRNLGRGKEKLAITLTIQKRVRIDNQVPVSDLALDSRETEKYLEIYRKEKNILSQEEVKQIRESLGLSQRGLANLVGWSSSTIERYEANSIPNPANDKILRSLSNKNIVMEYFQRSEKEKYSSNDFEAIQTYLNVKENRSVFYSAKEVSDWFVAESIKEQLADDEAMPITQMKLQKLVYFAQRAYLKMFSQPLFEENTLAYMHGVFYRSIGNAYRGKFLFEGGKVPERDQTIYYLDQQKEIDKADDVRNVLNEIWSKYGKYEASYLRKINHYETGAWYKNFKANQKNIVIPNEDILLEPVAE